MGYFRFLLMGWALAMPLAAQYVIGSSDIKLLVPRAAMVKEPVAKLLLVRGPEVEAIQVAELLRVELARQPGFQVIQPAEGSPLAQGLASLDALTEAQRVQLAATSGASHLMWVRFERFSYKEKNSVMVIRGKRFFTWMGVAKGLLSCPVVNLLAGTITTVPPQNIFKQYDKESDGNPPPPPPEGQVRKELFTQAARKALQMVMTVHAVRPLPFDTTGALSKVLATLKTGNLDEALAQVRQLDAASTGESVSFQARVHYDLGLLLCLKNLPAEALLALEAAQKGNYAKADVQQALEACHALLGASPAQA